MKVSYRLILGMLALLTLFSATPGLAAAPPATNPQNGAIGLSGRISSAPPSTAPSITNPSSGTTFTTLPITVAGLCTSNLLVEIFKNGVFAGSVVCSTGSYSLSIDLFGSQNVLVARQYDALDQASPDSNQVTVTFNDQVATTTNRITLLSNYAVRGTDANTPLSWPLTISGGTAPYAVSVDWGDKTSADVISRPVAGDFTITHTYTNAGSYNITVKASDANNVSAFLQLVGIGNGPVAISSSASNSANSTSKPTTKVVTWPIIVLLGLSLGSFWLGGRHRVQIIRRKIRSGQRPF